MRASPTTAASTVGTAPAVRPWKVWVAAGLLVVAVVAAYGNSFNGPFIFDDTPSIVENSTAHHLASWDVFAAPPETFTAVGRPVLNISLAINYAAGGLNVEGYHVVNLVIHLLAALVLFGLVRRTLLLPALAERFGSASPWLALAVALLWALHPLQTESVTYIVQRAEALMGLFYLLTLYCLVRGAVALSGRWWYAAAVGACVLGMGSKEVMVSAPLVALVYDRLFISGSFRQSLRQRWRLYAALAATWVVLGLVVYQSLGRGGTAGFGLGMTVWEYARTQFGCIIDYLRLAFWPTGQALDYGTRTADTAAEIVPYAIGVGLLVAATVAALVKWPRWGFLGLWFFAILAPTSSVVPLSGQTEAEHRMYLALAAVVTLAVLGACAVLERLGRRLAFASRSAAGYGPRRLGLGIGAAMVAVVAAALGWTTHVRNEDYRSAFAMWDRTVENRPLNYRAYINRGNAYGAKGRHDMAIADFSTSIQLKSDNPGAYENRGSAYAATGRYEDALTDYDEAIRQQPKYEGTFNERAKVFVMMGRYDEAIGDYDKAIDLKPNATAYTNRGNLYGAKGQFDAAIRDFDKAIAMKPDLPEAYNNRGNAYSAKGQFDVAVRDYGKAIELRPDDAATCINRATAYFFLKDYDRAWADVKTCRRLGVAPPPEFVRALTVASGRSE